jgi:hypothetical protein
MIKKAKDLVWSSIKVGLCLFFVANGCFVTLCFQIIAIAWQRSMFDVISFSNMLYVIYDPIICS